MATLALAAVGAAVGSTLLPSGIAVLGATLTGAAIGTQIGALAGSYIDQALFGASGGSKQVQGPRLSDLHVTASTEGAAIPRVYGRVRSGGQVIWATDFEEETVTQDASGGGKGIGGGDGATQTTYRYYANFAVALAEGEIASIGRVWANGQEIDLSQLTYRLYTGAPDQPADTLIQAREGAANTPAFRDTAYIVFERLPLAAYGNHLPQLSFEIYRAIEPFAAQIEGVVVIPGSGEFVYATTPVTLTTGYGTSTSENVHTRQGSTDWSVSMDQLQSTLPNANAVSLIVSWFGTDLRADHCQIVPGVERRDKLTSPDQWSVAGVDRTTAYVVSQREGRAAYGGTPSDATVISAIRDLIARGKSVTLTPFILMDVPGANTLPNPYGGASQPAYPWRGRITVFPAPGQPSSPDKTAAAATQLAAFIGTATPAEFALSGDTVIYSGSAEWSFRRMVLHQAMLAKAAGGVAAFVIGTELRGLTTVRAASNTYPFVTALVALAADVKTILGPTVKVTYAADWSEYFGHHPADGSNDVTFHLDPLWSSPHIDAIGLDVYWPLSDWRDGHTHRDAIAGTRQIYDLAYLKRNVTSGEGFDWYYASDTDRDAQLRAPITDGLGKPWTYRYKDIRSWWLNAHYNRTGGIESPTPTAWIPQSKPFWFMEIGCAAADKASNQPNVFVDPKSSETALPYFSRGLRDDLIQRRYLRALIEAFDPSAPGYVSGTNPLSTLTGQPMVALDHIHVYAWDARPFPAFPANTELWGDGENWHLGHWLNGRLASAPLSETVAAILDDYGFSQYDVTGLSGTVTGYAIDRIMSAREALSAFELAFFIDTVESSGKLSFRQRGASAPILAVGPDQLVETKPSQALISLTRGQETELPAIAKIRYLAGAGDYRQAVAESRRLTGASGRVSQADLAIVMDADQASAITDSWLFEAWAARERAAFMLPPSSLALEPGDIVSIEIGPDSRTFRLTEIGEHGTREIQARSIDVEVYGATSAKVRPPRAGDPVTAGQPVLAFLDLPLLRGDENPLTGYIAAFQSPWPGGVAVYSSPEQSGFRLKAIAPTPATMGQTLSDLPAGPTARWDNATQLQVLIGTGTLTSASKIQVLAGANIAAVQTPSGDWEVLQFTTATLTAPNTYVLSGLLRGQAGTDATFGPAIPAASPFVLLNSAVTPLALTSAETRLPLNWRYGPSSRGIGDATFATATHTFQALALRPLSPVHPKAQRATNGDLTLTWIRRTRISGDSWELPDVPVSEDSERYEADILSGATVKRTLVLTSPTLTYTAADQIADFGALQSTLTIRLAQLSSSYGHGTPLTVTV
ncbi:MAG: glycoside hydrolase/phage tail family protein [Hyphomicrobiaceae bacterium]